MESYPDFSEVARIISEKLDVPAEQVTLQASFINDLGADSLDLIELQMTLEETYPISISDEQGGKFTIVQDVIDFLKKQNPPA